MCFPQREQCCALLTLLLHYSVAFVINQGNSSLHSTNNETYNVQNSTEQRTIAAVKSVTVTPVKLELTSPVMTLLPLLKKDLNLQNMTLLKRIQTRATHSKDAVWATISLTFICVVLVLAVAQSKMWKEKHIVEDHGVPLPSFNERVPFQEVIDRKISLLREIFSKKSRKAKQAAARKMELESLLVDTESE